jgi:orotate phosphoribosyltransferase
MFEICPECSKEVPGDCRLPYVCTCTKAVLTTRRTWKIPGLQKLQSEARAANREKVRESQRLKEEQGRKRWKALHLNKDCSRIWYKAWKDEVVGSKCGCGNHFASLEKTHPISFESEQAFFESSIVLHNEVNKALNKPVCSLDRAYALWRHRRPDTGRKRCIVSVATGYDYIAMSRLTWPLMQAYADRCEADFIGLDNQTEEWALMEKFRTWHFCQQYDEVLFLDADCVVKPTAPNIFDEYSETICVHDDGPRIGDAEWLRRDRKAIAAVTGKRIPHTSQCFNSGVVLSRKLACDIWKRPEQYIGTSHCIEQTWVGEQLRKAVKNGATLKTLDSKWNWQWWFNNNNAGEFDAGLRDAYIAHFAAHPNRCEAIKEYIDVLQGKDLVQSVITWDQFTRDTLTLSQIILDRHPDVAGIAGVPRSGMRAACDISIRLGVPLYEITAAGLRYIGGGSRIRVPSVHGKRIEHGGEIIVVDDSSCTGRSAEEINTDLPFYVVYATNRGKQKITGCAVDLEMPHLFDWNLFNNGYTFRTMNVGIDFDGVLCDDCPIGDDDDGPRYREWMTTRKPIRTPRDYTVPFIITARREAYRDLTEEWLSRYRISYGQLVMYPGTFEERNRSCMGSWKAEQCQKFNVGWFIESSYEQAKVMSQILRKTVISIEPKPCPNAFEAKIPKKLEMQ